ncbi:MAG: hypothetical protein IT288_06410 [Bdellovibrionales bacterium]|nr:hypothetical protein [Bdellovibrionales bacterium]
MSNKFHLKQTGQMVVEMLLLLTVLFGVTLAISSYFRKEEIFVQLISGPWQNLSGMIQNGVWAPPAASMHNHPNHHSRHVSLKGTSAL